jgi:hypothetical protein
MRTGTRTGGHVAHARSVGGAAHEPAPETKSEREPLGLAALEALGEEKYLALAVERGKFPASRREHYAAELRRDRVATAGLVDQLAEVPSIVASSTDAAEPARESAPIDHVLAGFGLGERAPVEHSSPEVSHIVGAMTSSKIGRQG